MAEAVEFELLTRKGIALAEPIVPPLKGKYPLKAEVSVASVVILFPFA